MSRHFTLDDLKPAQRAEAERQMRAAHYASSPNFNFQVIQYLKGKIAPLAPTKPTRMQKKAIGEPARKKYEPHAHRPLPHPKPQPHQKAALDGSGAGETKGFPCTVVRFTGYRARPLDPDNFAGSVKDLLDGLRHAGLIPGDEPWRIRLETDQVKIANYAEERIVISIVGS